MRFNSFATDYLGNVVSGLRNTASHWISSTSGAQTRLSSEGEGIKSCHDNLREMRKINLCRMMEHTLV